MATIDKDEDVFNRETRVTTAACQRAQEIHDLIDKEWPGQSELNQAGALINSFVLFAEQPEMHIESAMQMVLDVYSAVESRRDRSVKDAVMDIMFRAMTGRKRAEKKAEPATT